MGVTQKPFPYGVNELKEAGLTALASEKVKPPRVKECKAHMECRVLWTKVIGAASLVLGSIEAVSVDKDLKEADFRKMAIALHRPIFFSYHKDRVRGYGCLAKWEKSTG